MATARDTALARDIVLGALRGIDADVYLFGSVARGAPRPGSDIDIGVLPRTTLPRGKLAALREALEEAPIVARVDLVDLSEVRPAFRQAVLREGVRWSD